MPGPNCLLGICCPPGSPEAKAALATEIVTGLELDKPSEEVAEEIARWLLDNYDLAPHGSLRQLFADVAAFARENP
jgi:hypothetical protein